MRRSEAARTWARTWCEVPPALREKLPQDFRQLVFGASDFDQIALDAEAWDVSHPEPAFRP